MKPYPKEILDDSKRMIRNNWGQSTVYWRIHFKIAPKNLIYIYPDIVLKGWSTNLQMSALNWPEWRWISIFASCVSLSLPTEPKFGQYLVSSCSLVSRTKTQELLDDKLKWMTSSKISRKYRLALCRTLSWHYCDSLGIIYIAYIIYETTST